MPSRDCLAGLRPHAQLGVNSVTVRVDDGRDGEATQSFEIVVQQVLQNRSPQVISSPPTTGVVGERYHYVAAATDEDSDSLLFDLPLRPLGMAIDSSTGAIGWVPTAAQLGIHDVILRVKDGHDGVDLQAFQIDVNRSNAAPVIVTAPAERAIRERPYRYGVGAQDADGDLLTYSLTTGPRGMTIDSHTGLVSWDVPPNLSLAFDGVDDYVATPLNIDQSDDSSGITFEAWVYPATDSRVPLCNQY